MLHDVDKIKQDVRTFLDKKEVSSDIDFRAQIEAKTSWSANRIKEDIGEEFFK